MRTEDLPELPGYLTVAAVAKMFGMKKESVFYKIYEQKAFKHVYKIGSPEETKRPVVVLLEAEVKEVFAHEMNSTKVTSDAALLNAWNKRVKQWGADTGWDKTPIQKTGRPPLSLVEAYLGANPNDPRPE